MSLSSTNIGDLLAGIASEAPAPGAGSGGAVALAVGLACARKAVILTLKHNPEVVDLAALDQHLTKLTERALAGGGADMAGFTAYIDALARPEAEPDRDEAERDALADLVTTDEKLIAIGDEARERLLAVRERIIPAVAGDLAAAFVLIDAARAIHAACVAESARALNP